MKKHQQTALVCSLSLIFCIRLGAQPVIDYSTHAPREGDTIMVCPVGCLPPGEEGVHAVWDFTELTPIGDTYPVSFIADTLGQLRQMEPTRIVTYRMSEDSLLQTGYETRLRRMTYHTPICLTTFPAAYGDFQSDNFRGSGLYCERMAIHTEGTTSVEVDGEGMMLLGEGDTLRNVLRLHRLKTASVWMHEADDSTETSAPNRRQEIEECYEWYARGYRYPVLKTVQTTFYDGLQQVSSQQSAFINLPSWQVALNDSLNREIQLADSLESLQRETQPIMSYTARLLPSGQLQVDYSLSQNASITFLVCNAMGITYVSTTISREQGDGYTAVLDCSALPHGTYLLYINCNGQVQSEVFQKTI